MRCAISSLSITTIPRSWKHSATVVLPLPMPPVSPTSHLPADVLTQALLWAGLLINCAEYFTSLDQAVMGAAAGYGSLWLLNAVYRALRGTDGMGAGDFKLLAAIGAWLGLTALPAVVLIAASTGVLTGLLLGL
ncbi:MAG: prepilin peptidase, partial [Betaproteobacteria bacterium]|nr:prepilin peptidase [Betaproteobacteria bacterium]